MAVAHDQPVPRLVELAGQRLDVSGRLGLDSGGQHPGAPSRTISSSPAAASSARASSSATTVNIGVSFLAGVSPPANLVLVNEEGTPRLERMVDPQVLVITRRPVLAPKVGNHGLATDLGMQRRQSMSVAIKSYDKEGQLSEMAGDFAADVGARACYDYGVPCDAGTLRW